MADRPPTYETGMRISYDKSAGKVTIMFRGRITVIDGNYASESEAIAAGEMHCRQLGWRPEIKPKTGVSMMRRR